MLFKILTEALLSEAQACTPGNSGTIATLLSRLVWIANYRDSGKYAEACSANEFSEHKRYMSGLLVPDRRGFAVKVRDTLKSRLFNNANPESKNKSKSGLILLIGELSLYCCRTGVMPVVNDLRPFCQLMLRNGWIHAESLPPTEFGKPISFTEFRRQADKS
jgi:hypothetical protein